MHHPSRSSLAPLLSFTVTVLRCHPSATRQSAHHSQDSLLSSTWAAILIQLPHTPSSRLAPHSDSTTCPKTFARMLSGPESCSRSGCQIHRSRIGVAARNRCSQRSGLFRTAGHTATPIAHARRAARCWAFPGHSLMLRRLAARSTSRVAWIEGKDHGEEPQDGGVEAGQLEVTWIPATYRRAASPGARFRFQCEASARPSAQPESA